MSEAVTRQLQKAKEAAWALQALDDGARNTVLAALAQTLEASAPDILRENAKDLALMPAEDPRHDRLLLNEERIRGIAQEIRKVASLPSPLGRVLEQTVRPNGLEIRRVSVPLGVVGVIYESRPNVTIDVFALCFKAGNVCVLKGGKEARHSNAVLAGAVTAVLEKHGISPDALQLLTSDREATAALLNATAFVDVCIPRGSQALIDYVRDNAKVPVIETGAGIVHTYFDKYGDAGKGRSIIANAKTRRVSVCNALDTLVIHKDRLADLASLVEPLKGSRVEIFADADSHGVLEGHYPGELLRRAAPEDFGREFLSYKMSVKTVAGFDEALEHIRHHSSRHSEAIITEDGAVADRFMRSVDAAAVYANASTAFTDGAQFGMGAEIGISTQKLHARGPMGLEALTSYKWLVTGNGQTRP